MKRLIPFAICMLLCLSACKKWQHQYPEDTEKTKLTPTERLTNKWWTLQSVSVNGADCMDSVNTLFGKYTIFFSNNMLDISNGVTTNSGNIKTEFEVPFSSIWKLTNEQTSIIIGPENGNGSNITSIVPGYLSHSSFSIWEYKIIKLSEAELKISISTKNNDSLIINTYSF